MTSHDALARLTPTDDLRTKAVSLRDSVSTYALWIFKRLQSPNINPRAVHACYDYTQRELQATVAELKRRTDG